MPFRDFLGIVEERAYPLRAMWPSFWLKAVAVRQAETWNLCYFSLFGRWSELPSVRELREQSDGLVAVSIPLDADAAWELIGSLVADECATLLPGIVATLPRGPDFASPSFPWEEPVRWQLPATVVDVIQPAHWRYLHAQGTLPWLSDTQAQFALQRTLKPYLDHLSLPDYQTFIASRLGSGQRPTSDYSFDMFQYLIDLPLGLRVKLGVPDASTDSRPILLGCRRPLTLKEITVTSGTQPGPDLPNRPVQAEATSEDGWSYGTVVVPVMDSKLWLASPHLYKQLLYEWPLPMPEDQAAHAVGYVYAPMKPDEGIATWHKRLLEGKDAEFELALANALARLGIPTVFSGQLRQDGQTSGPATPGFDLVALDHAHRRALVISAKGISRNPGDDDIEKLLKGIAIVGAFLHRWRVVGVIACHASAERLARLRERTDLRFWGQEELKALVDTDTREAIEYLVWGPPGWPLPNRLASYL